MYMYMYMHMYMHMYMYLYIYIHTYSICICIYTSFPRNIFQASQKPMGLAFRLMWIPKFMDKTCGIPFEHPKIPWMI